MNSAAPVIAPPRRKDRLPFAGNDQLVNFLSEGTRLPRDLEVIVVHDRGDWTKYDLGACTVNVVAGTVAVKKIRLTTGCGKQILLTTGKEDFIVLSIPSWP